MDSSGVLCLLQLHAEAGQTGAQLTVSDVSAVVERAFRLIGIADVLRQPH